MFWVTTVSLAYVLPQHLGQLDDGQVRAALGFAPSACALSGPFTDQTIGKLAGSEEAWCASNNWRSSHIPPGSR